MSTFDHQNRNPRHVPPCQHPPRMIRRSGNADFRVCTACGQWRGAIDFGEYCDMVSPPSLSADAAQRIANGEPWSKVFPLPTSESLTKNRRK